MAAGAVACAMSCRRWAEVSAAICIDHIHQTCLGQQPQCFSGQLAPAAAAAAAVVVFMVSMCVIQCVLIVSLLTAP